MKFIRDILSPLLIRYNPVVRMLLPLLFVSAISFAGSATKAALSDPELVASFYKRNDDKMFWFSGTSDGASLRRQLINFLTVSEVQGLHPEQYRIEELKMLSTAKDNVTGQHNADGLFTDVALAYMKDLLQGKLPPGFVSYDELSSAVKQKNDELLIDLLAHCTDSASLIKTLKHLEPATSEYQLLKTAMVNALQTGSTDTIQQLEIALNAYRWVHHFHSAKYIVVSIPSAKLYYYEHDSLKLEMKVVVGKPVTPTPRFAARCNEIILYPYWNVPQSIAVNEFLPMCKKGYGVLNIINMQVLDSKGRIVNRLPLNGRLTRKIIFLFASVSQLVAIMLWV